MPPPQNTSWSPYFSLSFRGSIPAAEHWTGLMMSNPTSMKFSMKVSTAPQECLNVFQPVLRWIHSFTCR